jgi:hypothetical protein
MVDGEVGAGWYPDPSAAHESRYWSGSQWTDDVADRGVTSKAPFTSPAAPPTPLAVAPPAPVTIAPPASFGSPGAAKAQAAAAKAYAKARRPVYKKKRYYLLALILVIIVAAIAAGSSNKTKTSAAANGGTKTLSDNGTHPPQADVSITGCSADALNQMQALVKVTNHSSGRSDYIIGVSFDSKDGKTQLDTSSVLVNNLEPGQTTNQTGTTLTDVKGAFKCRVTDVNRFASN